MGSHPTPRAQGWLGILQGAHLLAQDAGLKEEVLTLLRGGGEDAAPWLAPLSSLLEEMVQASSTKKQPAQPAQVRLQCDVSIRDSAV